MVFFDDGTGTGANTIAPDRPDPRDRQASAPRRRADRRRASPAPVPTAPPEQRRVLATRREAGVTVQRSDRSKTTRSAGAPSTRSSRAWRPRAEHAGRTDGQGLDRATRAAGRIDGREDEAERGLDAADPVRRQAELDRLVDLGVRRMVRRDRVGRAVDEGREAGGRIVGRSQRRVDAGRRVVRARDEGAIAPTGPPLASHAHRLAPATHSSVSARWWGVTSQVTGRPAALARRIRSSASAVETWVRCRRAPGSSRTTSARIARSRATAAPRRRPASPADPARSPRNVVRLGAAVNDGPRGGR